MKRLLGLAAFVVVLIVGAGTSRAEMMYEVFLDGPSEDPPNASPGTGFAKVVIDLVAHTLSLDVSFSDLIGTTTAAHLHAPTAMPFMGTAGVATETPFFTGFPIGVTSGTYSHVFDTTMTSTFNAPYVTANGGTAAGAEAALAAALADGKAYLNIHTTVFPGGEIRGFAQAVAVPEPSTLTLVAAGGLGLILRRRRRVGSFAG